MEKFDEILQKKLRVEQEDKLSTIDSEKMEQGFLTLAFLQIGIEAILS